jgi:predicted phage terminase large subunit-like protein
MAEPPAGAPAYARDPRKLGEALWPGKFPADRLAKIKSRYRKSGLRWWNALYQQRPSSAEGEIFKQEYWGYATQAQVKEGTICKIQSADTAHGVKDSNARSVIATFAVMKGGMAVLIDLWKDKVEFPALKRQAKAQYNKHAPYRVLIEDKASGKDLIPELAETLPRDILVAVEPAGDKIARANAAVGMVEEAPQGEQDPKRVLLLEGAPWLKEFIDELAGFPTGKYADQVDTFTQFCAWYRTEWREPAERVLINRGRRDRRLYD